MTPLLHSLRAMLKHARALDRPTIEAAIAEIEQARALLPGVYYMDPPDGGSVEMIVQLRRMADDAARFRLLAETTDSDAVDGLYAAADVIAFKYQVPIKRIQELIAADTAVGWIALLDAVLAAERRE